MSDSITMSVFLIPAHVELRTSFMRVVSLQSYVHNYIHFFYTVNIMLTETFMLT